jgi:hypothetical protein
MRCSIKNVPRNTKIATGNRGAKFPIAPKNCTFAISLPDCFLGTQESRHIGIMTEAGYKLMFECPVRIQDCYIAMQEDGFTPLLLQNDTNYFELSCLQTA